MGRNPRSVGASAVNSLFVTSISGPSCTGTGVSTSASGSACCTAQRVRQAKPYPDAEEHQAQLAIRLFASFAAGPTECRSLNPFPPKCPTAATGQGSGGHLLTIEQPARAARPPSPKGLFGGVRANRVQSCGWELLKCCVFRALLCVVGGLSIRWLRVRVPSSSRENKGLASTDRSGVYEFLDENSAINASHSLTSQRTCSSTLVSYPASKSRDGFGWTTTSSKNSYLPSGESGNCPTLVGPLWTGTAPIPAQRTAVQV